MEVCLQNKTLFHKVQLLLFQCVLPFFTVSPQLREWLASVKLQLWQYADDQSSSKVFSSQFGDRHFSPATRGHKIGHCSIVCRL